MQTVAEIMTRDVQAVAPEDSLRRAAQLMDDLNVGALPVCTGDRLVGIVTDRDITVRGTSAGMAPDTAHVDQVMSTDVRACCEDEPVDEVLRQMADTQIRRVPVLASGDGKLVGMLSLGDIATRADAQLREEQISLVVERVSYPSEPDRSAAGNGASGEARASGMHSDARLAGSDVLADQMNPGIEVSGTADPSDMVEVTPRELVNRNAPGSRIPNTPDGAQRNAARQGVTVRHVAGREGNGSTGASGAPAGSDAAGASGASGGTAGTAAAAGTEGGAAT